MKTFTKRILAILVACSLLLLPSCSRITGYIDDYKYIGSAIVPDKEFTLTKELDYTFDEEILTQIEDRFEKLDELLEANDILRSVAFLTLFAQQSSDLYYLADHAKLAYLKFCVDPTENSESMDEYTRLSNLYTDYSSRIIRMYRTIHNSVYKNQVFGNWDKSQVDFALSLADSYTDEVVQLTKERDDLLADYHKLDQDDPSFVNESAQIYHSIIKLNKQIAEKSGYDSYADYAYHNVYFRDYSTDDAQKLHQYVKDYIVPLAKQLSEELMGYISDPEYLKKYQTLMMQDLVSNPDDEYYDLMYLDGDELIDTWQSLTVFGDENSYPGAYTASLVYYEQPFCYYGADYQDAFTVIHEQGHFLAALEMPGGFDSIDLCEVHSQGNEWLYLAYLKENAQDDENYEKIAKTVLFENCITIILATVCDMFEQRVYETPPATYAAYDGIFSNCLNELDAKNLLKENMNIAPEHYWHYAIVSNSMYYLSYAVSMIPSVELYILAEENGLEGASETYLTLSDGESFIGFEEALDEAGLSSPFEESVYLKIKEYFS